MQVFYSRERGDYVVDAICECGHPKRAHGSKLNKLPRGRFLRVPHDGNCCESQCPCPRFVWAGWITATEFEQMIPEHMKQELAAMG